MPDYTLRVNGASRTIRTDADTPLLHVLRNDFDLNGPGGIIQSTSWTLKEQVKFDLQRVTTRSWSDYPILMFPEVPAIDVHLINRPNEKSLGCGEGSQGPAVAAIADAIANATGKRLRDLPFTPDKIKAALV